MRVEKTYHRADMRTLSTESYVKLQRKSLGTQWLWYKREDSGDWAEYGVKVRETKMITLSSYITQYRVKVREIR